MSDVSPSVSSAVPSVPFILPMTMPSEQRFRELASRWRKETAFLSSTSEIATHPSYQQIIGMGKESLPFIFAALREQPEHWFWALRSITGEDPVPPSDRGDLRKMTAAWLKWASEHQY